MAGADTDPMLREVLMTMARRAGAPVDEETAARLTVLLAALLTDWETLTGAVAPEVEPMSVGRWPEASDALE